jgi:hypothetical protein
VVVRRPVDARAAGTAARSVRPVGSVARVGRASTLAGDDAKSFWKKSIENIHCPCNTVGIRIVDEVDAHPIRRGLPERVGNEHRSERRTANSNRQNLREFPSRGGLGAPGMHIIPMPVPQPTAIFGLPGILRADKDFIALPSGFPKLATSAGAFTIAAWVKTTDRTQPGQRIVADDENNATGNWGFSLGDPGTGQLRFFLRQGAVFILDTPAGSPIANATWYYVAVAVSLAAGANQSSATIYAYNQAGTLVTSATGTFTWTANAATPEEIEAAARAANAHEFVVSLPDGYHTMIGERGQRLSGGQRQRIAIARALLSRPALLIFDDSTSAVDVETEARIQAALDSMPVRPTRVVVAQRISTVLSADTILVLDDGRVAAQGTHAQLLAASPIYREIYESQMDNGAIIHD